MRDFEAFVTERQQALLRYAMVLCGDARLAEDMVADVLGRCFERWSRVGAVDQPVAYVRKMIVNEYLSRRRRLLRLVPSADVTALAEAVPDHADGHVERDAMVERLARLPARQRAVIVLRFYLDLSDAEIAGMLGCRESTVRSNAARALAALRATSGAREAVTIHEGDR